MKYKSRGIKIFTGQILSKNPLSKKISRYIQYIVYSYANKLNIYILIFTIIVFIQFINIFTLQDIKFIKKNSLNL